MFNFLLALLILDSIVLATVVLLQAGKGGGLAAMGGGAGTDTLFGGRHAATLLTRLSWWCGGAFIAIAFALSILASRGGSGADSLLQREFQRGAVPGAEQPAAPVPAPVEQAPVEVSPTAPLSPESATPP